MDGKHHDLDNLFQNAFSEHKVTPSSNLWSKIEEDLPLSETDKVFKRAFNNYEKEPKPEVWDHIKPHLPFSLLLRNTVKHLSRIAAIFLIGMFAYLTADNFGLFNQKNRQLPVAIQETAEQNQNEQQAAEIPYENAVITAEESTETASNLLEAPIASNFKIGGENVIKSGSVNRAKTEAVVLNINLIAEKVKNGDNSRIPSSELFEFEEELEEGSKALPDSLLRRKQQDQLKNKRMEDVYYANVIYPTYPEDDNNTKIATAPVHMSLNGQAEPNYEEALLELLNQEAALWKKINPKGIYLGFNVNLGNTLIHNNALKQATAVAASRQQLSFGYQLGASVGYRLSSFWALETGINLTQYRQTYENISDASPTVQLSYWSIPLNFKYTTRAISGTHPQAMSYVFGLQAGALNSSNDLAIQHELGLSFGVDYDIFLNPNLSLSLGGRLQVSTDTQRPFNNFNNFIGIRTALNFAL